MISLFANVEEHLSPVNAAHAGEKQGGKNV